MQLIRQIKAYRKKNIDKYLGLRIFLAAFFPIFMTLITELNQMRSIPKLLKFIIDRPTIILFDIIIISAIYATFLFFTKRTYLSTLFTGVMFFVFSCVEYFKYEAGGTHFTIVDMLLITDAHTITKFTRVYLAPILCVTGVIMLAYIVATFFFSIELKMKYHFSALAGLMTIVILMFSIISPAVSTTVYGIFDVDTQDNLNMFKSDEKFNNNNLIAYLTQSVSALTQNKVREPMGYSEEKVIQILGNNYDDAIDGDFIRPNVVFIMSEAYTDLRRFDGVDIPDSVYSGLDEVAKKGHRGMGIVPTIGGYTVKTEFELMFGVPIKSLNNYELPQNLLKEGEQATFADYYDSLGYSTTYIHPFNKSFYNRDKIYSEYGFDELLFLEDLIPDIEQQDEHRFRQFTDDKIIFDEIEKQLKEHDSPCYIHATTMQNHKPYQTEEFPGDEIELYLEGIEHSNELFADFVNRLEDFDEPTIVLFIGDHFPMFYYESGFYEDAQISSDNCFSLYEQEYVIWDNFGVDYSKTPDNAVSSFYLPHIVADLIDAPKNTFMNIIMGKMEEVPVYTITGFNDSEIDAVLDTIAYDRTKGDKYSYYNREKEIEEYVSTK